MDRAGDDITEFVHKAAKAEALFTEWWRKAESTLSIRVDLEAAARLGHKSGDAIFTAELIRQSTILSAHALFNVPMGWAFLMDRMRVDLQSVDVHRAQTVQVSAKDVMSRGEKLRSMTSEVIVECGGYPIATGLGELRLVEPATFARMRRQRSLSPGGQRTLRAGPGYRLRELPPRSSGRRWTLHYDERDPFFFDHPVDHVPGMLLFAALRQAGLNSSGGKEIIRFDGYYRSFVELGQSPEVTIESFPANHGLRRLCGQIHVGETLAVDSSIWLLAT